MKISIITITYNSEKTVEDTICSILSQNLQGIELEYIIVDGKSIDGTLKIVEKYKSKIAKVISEKDRGISDAFNKGIKMATGEIIGIINSDDMLLPNALQTLKSYYEPEVDVYFGNGQRLYSNGTTKEYRANSNLNLLKKGMYLDHPSVFVRKSAYEKYGYFDIHLKCVMDRDLLLRMYLSGAKFKYIDSELTIFRDGGMSNKQFFTITLPEEEIISIRAGMSPFKAKVLRFKKYVYMHIVFGVKRMKGKI